MEEFFITPARIDTCSLFVAREFWLCLISSDSSNDTDLEVLTWEFISEIELFRLCISCCSVLKLASKPDKLESILPKEALTSLLLVIAWFDSSSKVVIVARLSGNCLMTASKVHAPIGKHKPNIMPISVYKKNDFSVLHA